MLDFVCKILSCDIPGRKSVQLKTKFSVFKKFNCVTGFNCVMDLNHSPKFHSYVPSLKGILWEKVISLIKIMLARPGSTTLHSTQLRCDSYLCNTKLRASTIVLWVGCHFNSFPLFYSFQWFCHMCLCGTHNIQNSSFFLWLFKDLWPYLSGPCHAYDFPNRFSPDTVISFPSIVLLPLIGYL